MKYISHRGNRIDNFLENTQAAFLSALEFPLDMIEMDLRLSHDGVWMVYHDRTLSRLFGQELWFSQTKSKTLQSHGILTLKQVLTLINGRTELYLDIKQEPLPTKNITKLWNQLANVVTNQKNKWSAKKIYLAAFSSQIITFLAEYQQSQEIKFPLGLITGNDYQTLNPDLISKLDLISFEADILTTKQEVNHIRKQHPDLEIYVYVLNDLISLTKYQNLEVDGVLTDHPELFLNLQRLHSK